MARREIVHEELPRGQFLKQKELFADVGDKFVGVFWEEAIVNGNYGEKANFSFILPADKTLGIISVGLKAPLYKMLKKAELTRGEKVTIDVVGMNGEFPKLKITVEDGPKGLVPVTRAEPEDDF